MDMYCSFLLIECASLQKIASAFRIQEREGLEGALFKLHAEGPGGLAAGGVLGGDSGGHGHLFALQGVHPLALGGEHGSLRNLQPRPDRIQTGGQVDIPLGGIQIELRDRRNEMAVEVDVVVLVRHGLQLLRQDKYCQERTD